ncbi:hypothetical protein OZD68_03690 [Wolbachia endosymbiont of Drosophila bicornuta]|uniref:hypothetical protein n=1 Tax=Wolbachia TaxID=953 RepID=UPI0015FC1864|nr:MULTISPECIES: hypothetical protein [Wolbachia]MBA8755401.1 hypothetical protein [Wolbachia pipientis]MDE5056678.1 hypothetical protein [Wolbachia endosymbiont of Drosophila bicornuta]
MLLLYHSHKHISYPIRTIARSAIISKIVCTIAAFFFESSFFDSVISAFNAGRKCWI